MTPEEFRQQHPAIFYLNPARPDELAAYLGQHGLLADGETIKSVRKAGEGNMNCTVRVVTECRSLIVKQSRPWVEKYPQFAAPWDRAREELRFYRLVADFPEVSGRMPRLLAGDPEARVLVLEDLGSGGDFTDVYAGRRLERDEMTALARFLSALHRIPLRPDLPEAARLTNRAMRELNHAHIFAIPLQAENGLDLDRILPGLAAAAAPFKRDAALRETFARLGVAAYLTDGPCLLHGDFFPGSFVRTPAGPRVIDPEFGFFGRPEFDAGVLLAHLLLSGQSPVLRDVWLQAYQPPSGYDARLTQQLAGVEIIRRLIGYAQLPLTSSLDERTRLLELARAFVLSPSATPAAP